MSSITLLRNRSEPTMRHAMRVYQGTTLGSWLLMTGVLVPWCRHHPVRHKAVMMVSDTYLRALARARK